MMTLKPGQRISSPATLRQQSVLDRLARDLEGLRFSPAPAYKDLYESIGDEGVKKALSQVAVARTSAGKASAVIDMFFNQSLTRTIQYLHKEHDFDV